MSRQECTDDKETQSLQDLHQRVQSL